MDKYFEYKDINAYYQDEGQGEVIMFIHGFCFDGAIWDEFKETLSKTHRLIIPDLPGYRNTELTQAPLTVEWMAGLVKAMLDKEGIEKVTFIGHSMGGYIGVAFAELFPERLSKLGLFHSHPFEDGTEKSVNRKKAIRFLQKHGGELFVKELFNDLFAAPFIKSEGKVVHYWRERATKYPAETLITSTEAMIRRKDRATILSGLDVPVLFIIGKEDGAIPLELSLKQTHLPDIAEICLLDDTGHMGMLEKPDETLKVIQEFVNLNVG